MENPYSNTSAFNDIHRQQEKGSADSDQCGSVCVGQVTLSAECGGDRK